MSDWVEYWSWQQCSRSNDREVLYIWLSGPRNCLDIWGQTISKWWVLGRPKRSLPLGQGARAVPLSLFLSFSHCLSSSLSHIVSLPLFLTLSPFLSFSLFLYLSFPFGRQETERKEWEIDDYNVEEWKIEVPKCRRVIERITKM